MLSVNGGQTEHLERPLPSKTPHVVPGEIVDNPFRHSVIFPQVLHVNLLIGPLYPAAGLAGAVEQNETINQLGSSLGKSDQDVGPETDTKTDAVGDTVVMAHVFNHLEKIIVMMARCFNKKVGGIFI